MENFQRFGYKRSPVLGRGRFDSLPLLFYPVVAIKAT